MIKPVEVYLLNEVHLQDFQDMVGTNRKIELFDWYPTVHKWQRTAIVKAGVETPPHSGGANLADQQRLAETG
jgi:hypothetical protein